MITHLAPLIFAICAWKQPIGPAPIITTLSPNVILIFSWQAYTDDSGSLSVALSKFIFSGNLNTASLLICSFVTTTKSAKPPCLAI